MSLSCVIKISCGYPVYGDVLRFLALCDTLWYIGIYLQKKKGINKSVSCLQQKKISKQKQFIKLMPGHQELSNSLTSFL